MKGSADPDLTLIVTQTRMDGQKALSFVAKAREPEHDLHYTSFSSEPFKVGEQDYFQQLFLDLAQIPEDNPEERLADRGALLCSELLPVELQRRLWALIGRVRTIQVLSDEVWIPWEILRLQAPDDPSAPGRFLVEAFSVTRGLLKSPVVLDLPMRQVALVVPRDSGLPKASTEGERIKAFAGAARKVVDVPASYREVKDALAQGTFEGWHFAGHGVNRDRSPHRWCIVLERKQEVHPADLFGAARQLGRARPLVFLNACHSGRGAVSLTGMAGLASAFLKAGAGAFLGAHWALDDDQACCFSEVFYQHLFAGEEIGEAVSRARAKLRTEFPGSNDWLAYTVFAHPLARCRATRKRKTTPPPSPRPPDPPAAWSRPIVEVVAEPSGQEPERPAAPTPGQERIHEKDGLVLVYVPGGDFLLGAEDEPLSRPVRRVRLSPFWIGKHPVTNEQYARFLAENPSRPEPAFWGDFRFNQPRLPVVGVSWAEARDYCNWAGLEFPSEVQWEAAARGTDQRPFPWGRELPTPDHANFDGTGTTPVDEYPAGAGPYGTLGQSGNVWEWCADPWTCDAFRQMKDGQWDPMANGDVAVRPVRGGSWMNTAKALRTVLRERGTARRRLNTQGFRCIWRPE
jgi:formylglycine-generating enzyme required for sulfatase activity